MKGEGHSDEKASQEGKTAMFEKEISCNCMIK